MKMASLLAWCRVFFGMLLGGSGVEALAMEDTVASHPAPVLRHAGDEAEAEAEAES